MYAVFCGSRDWKNREAVREQLRVLDPEKDTIIHGAAPGLDSIAGLEADLMGFHVMPVQADWDGYGNSAGPVRNGWMRNMLVRARGYGDDVLVVAFHFDASLGRGTRDMVRKARKADIVSLLVVPDAEPDLRTASFSLYDGKGRMLLQHRTDDAPTYPGFHGLFGGALEVGESVRQALRREAMEELRVTLGRVESLGALTFQLPDRIQEINVFMAPLLWSLEQLRRQQREGQGLDLFHYGELDRLRVPSQDLAAFRAVRCRLKSGPIV